MTTVPSRVPPLTGFPHAWIVDLLGPPDQSFGFISFWWGLWPRNGWRRGLAYCRSRQAGAVKNYPVTSRGPWKDGFIPPRDAVVELIAGQSVLLDWSHSDGRPLRVSSRVEADGEVRFRLWRTGVKPLLCSYHTHHTLWLVTAAHAIGRAADYAVIDNYLETVG
jgi:hypothetical protein